MDIMKKLLTNCDIKYNGYIISHENLMKDYSKYLSRTMTKKRHHVDVIMHTGSVCFDALMIAYMAVHNMVSNTTTSHEVIASLRPGDKVTYNEKDDEKRYEFVRVFDGIEVDGQFAGLKYVKLKGNDGVHNVPEKCWRKIKPYYGTAETLDGKGIPKKNKLREDFYIEVLGYNREDIPNVVDSSSVIVASKKYIEDLLYNISFDFCGKHVRLLDLVPASSFSEGKETPCRGNSNRIEPVLKYCCKASDAGQLVKNKDGNNHMGIVFLGADTIRQAETEIPQLASRKSLKYLYLSCCVETAYIKTLLNISGTQELFICTREYLSTKFSEIKKENPYTAELIGQVKRIKYKENIPVNIENFPIDVKEYNLFYKHLERLRKRYPDSELAKKFIIHSHSLMNLFASAPANINLLNKIISKYKNNVVTTVEKLLKLREWGEEIGDNLYEDVSEILNILNRTCEGLIHKNFKVAWLTDFIRKNKKQKIAIVVTKEYFKDVIKKGAVLPVTKQNIPIYTYKNFDFSKSFDSIIILGHKYDPKFDIFNCFAAYSIYSLLYPVETIKYNYYKSKYYKELRTALKSSHIQYALDDTEEEFQNNQEYQGEEEIVEHEQIIDDLNVQDLFSFSDVQSNNTSRSNVLAEISAVARLEDERKVYFSKNYKGYIIDLDGGGIKEVGVNDLCEGNSLLFTKNNDDTKDIVDSVLHQLISSGKYTQEKINIYNDANLWKQALRKYMVDKELNVQEVASRLIALGETVKEATIRGWIDEDSHTVGPREESSLKYIGILTGNGDLEHDTHNYFLACKKMRQIRRNILKQIGEMIKDNIRGKEPSKESLLYDVYNKIDDISEVVYIDMLHKLDNEIQIPGNKANRPILE